MRIRASPGVWPRLRVLRLLVWYATEWLPLEETYEVLQDGALELGLSPSERRNRLMQIIMGLIPVTGLIAAFTAYLWRQYWGSIDVRVVDLGLDPTTRMFDVLIFFMRVIALFGPLLFVPDWVRETNDVLVRSERWNRNIAKLQSLKFGSFKFGRYLFNKCTARLLLGLVVLAIMFLLNEIMPLIIVLFIGPRISLVLLANLLDMDHVLPNLQELPLLDSKRIIIFLVLVLMGFMLILGVEVLVKGPDLRPDGLHRWIAPKVLGFHVQPIIMYDIEGKHEPLGALFLGGTSDLYVLYDPCTKVVRLVAVSLSRVEVVDAVKVRRLSEVNF